MFLLRCLSVVCSCSRSTTPAIPPRGFHERISASFCGGAADRPRRSWITFRSHIIRIYPVPTGPAGPGPGRRKQRRSSHTSIESTMVDGSTAVAAPPPTPRERGTLRDTLPGRPFAIFLILTACAVCSALAASLVVYSFPDKYEFANDATVYLFLVACLGSVSTAVGAVFGDSLTHLLAFGVAVRSSRCASNAQRQV